MFRSVEQQPLAEGGVREQLHFHEILATRLVACLDVEDRQAVVNGILMTERIQNLHVANGVCERTLDDRIQQMPEYVPAVLAAKHPLERIVHLRIDSRSRALATPLRHPKPVPLLSLDDTPVIDEGSEIKRVQTGFHALFLLQPFRTDYSASHRG